MTSSSFVLSVGYKFRPTDEELLLHYLHKKIHGLPYFHGAIFDFDLYGNTEPWEIWETFQGVDGEDLYFFTKLKRPTNASGHPSAHISRKVGRSHGTWSGENSSKSIFAPGTRNKIGTCKRFRYENIKLPEHHGEWIMHEYSLHENFDDYVLCRIRKNERPKRKEMKRALSKLHLGSQIQTVEPCQAQQRMELEPVNVNIDIATRGMTNARVSSHEEETIDMQLGVQNLDWDFSGKDVLMMDVDQFFGGNDTSLEQLQYFLEGKF